jgi:hypothetical protein
MAPELMAIKTSDEELSRYSDLKILEKSGQISRLAHQILFKPLINGVEVFEYTADFAYIESGVKVIEEYKGFLYERHDFRLRMRICSALYPDLLFRIVTKRGINTQYKGGKLFSKKPSRPKKLGRPKLT